MTSPEDPVQRQLDAYNAHDIERFVAEYHDDVRVLRPPATDPILSGKPAFREHYAKTLAGWGANLDRHWDEALAEVGRQALRARDADQDRDEAMVAEAMDRRREPDRSGPHAALGQRSRGLFGLARVGGVGRGHVGFGRDPAGCEPRKARRDEQRTM